jgi:hypothetical protein
MFDSVGARFALRSALVGLAVFLTSLQASLPFEGGDLVPALLAGVLAALAYAGIGAAIPAVEPRVGNKMDTVDRLDVTDQI